MKKSIIIAGLAITAYLLITIGRAYADWAPVGSRVNTVSEPNAGAPRISFLNNTPYIAFSFNDTTSHLYVKHFNGSAWVQDGGDLKINSGSTVEFLDIDFSSIGRPYVAWIEDGELYVKYFTGSSWAQAGGIINVDPVRGAFRVQMEIYNETPYVTWHEYNGSSNQIYVKHYNGSAWVQDGGSLNTNPSNVGFFPDICTTSTGVPYVAWHESEGSNHWIYVKHFNGSAWNQDGGQLNVTPNKYAELPAIAMAPLNIPYVAWLEWDALNQLQVYVKYFNGSTWNQLGGSLNVDYSYNTNWPRIAIASDGTAYVAWHATTDGPTQTKVYVKYYTGTQWLSLGNPSVGASADVAIAANQNPHVAWVDSGVIYVKYYDISALPTPLPTTTPTITPTQTHSPTLTPSPTNTPPSSQTPTLTRTPIPNFKGQIISEKYLYAAPNPARGNVANIVYFLAQNADIEIKVFNTTNDLVISKRWDNAPAGENHWYWNTSGIANGVYFLWVRARVSGSAEERLTKKIAIVH